MKYEVSASCCRICLTKNKKQRSLYKPIDDGDEPPNEMLQKVTGITVEEMEQFTMLPKNICKNCELSLSMAFEFREKVLQSQEVIVAYMQELQIPYPEEVLRKEEETKVQELKIEIKEKESQDAVFLHEFEESDVYEQTKITIESEHTKFCTKEILDLTDASENDFETGELNEETLDEVVETLDVSDRDENEPYVVLETEDDTMVSIENDNYEEIEDDAELQQYELEDNDEHQEFICEKENDKIVWRVEQIETDTEGELINHKLKQFTRRGRKPTRLGKKVSYICDICGNVYDKRGRMMEHRQRHDKQLKYACELCDAKFHMRELLRKHMYSHSGGKPLKCRFCSRKFYYESVRKAHEAVHEGLKPYVCETCGKAFSYAHSLKKHKLIHAEVKMFRCEYCKKDFRLQHHMKQHNMTRLHRKAVALAEGHYEGDNNNASIDIDNEEQEYIENVILEDDEIEQSEHAAS